MGDHQKKTKRIVPEDSGKLLPHLLPRKPEEHAHEATWRWLYLFNFLSGYVLYCIVTPKEKPDLPPASLSATNAETDLSAVLWELHPSLHFALHPCVGVRE